MACVSPEIADRCITLMAPSKTFNISGLGASYAIVQNKELRKRVKKAAAGLIGDINVLGIAAFKAAYTACDQWLGELLKYLLRNRDTLVDYVQQNFPGIKTTVPEATYLAWFDCRSAGIQESAYQFFLREAHVALTDGTSFGPGGEGFVRFNFACPHSQMLLALEQMKAALERLPVTPLR
jgi:cystathionine beta-lyase